NCCSQRFCCNRRRRASGGGNYVHLTANQFCDQVRDAIVLALRPTVFDRNIAAFYIARFAEALVKRAQSPAPLGGGLRTEEAEHATPRLRARGAGARAGRGDRRAADEQRDEVTTFQLIELHSVPCQPGPDCRISELARISQEVTKRF